MPCARKRTGRGCNFELLALRPNLVSWDIHVYAHSQHNHTFVAESKCHCYYRETPFGDDGTFGDEI
jgi:hypothetical protein